MFRPNINDAYIFTVIFFLNPCTFFCLNWEWVGATFHCMTFFFCVRSRDDATVVDDFAFLLYYNKFNFFVF